MLPYSSLLWGAGCQLSTQQFKERAVMSASAAGEGAAPLHSAFFLLPQWELDPHKWHFLVLTDSNITSFLPSSPTSPHPPHTSLMGMSFLVSSFHLSVKENRAKRWDEAWGKLWCGVGCEFQMQTLSLCIKNILLELQDKVSQYLGALDADRFELDHRRCIFYVIDLRFLFF